MNILESLKENDRICFLGDSITADGRWLRTVQEILIRQYSNKKIRLINCGVPGDNAKNAQRRLMTDCLYCFPKIVVVMFGMNDINRNAYEIDNDVNLALREKAILDYETAMTELIQKLKKADAQAVLCTPTPYNEQMISEAPNQRCDAGLVKCSKIVYKLAARYSCGVVDFHKFLLPYMKKENPQILNDDRIHPNDLGNLRMASVFMEQTGITYNGDLSELTISPANLERFTADDELRRLYFVEWVLLPPDCQDKMACIRKSIQKENPEGYVLETQQEYLQKGERLELFRSSVIEKNLNLYI